MVSDWAVSRTSPGLIDGIERRGSHGHAVVGRLRTGITLEQAAAEYPLNERLHALLMTALHRAGRPTDAVACYAAFTDRLAKQAGREPSGALRELHQRIVDRDEGMFSPAAAVDAVRGVPNGREPDSGTAHLEIDGRSVPLAVAVTTIGRLPDCGVVLRDPNVSRRHAEVRRTSTGFLLVDCESTNGVLVNGTAVSQVALRSGDAIEIGSSRIVFVVDD